MNNIEHAILDVEDFINYFSKNIIMMVGMKVKRIVI